MALMVACLMAGSDTATLVSVRENWPAWSADERVARAERVSTVVTDVAEQLKAQVAAVASDSAFVQRIRAGDISAIEPPMPAGIESAMLVFHKGQLVARTGQTHAPIPSSTVANGASTITLIDGLFHTSLLARHRDVSGTVEIVATVLLSSAPPAHTFARSLLQTLPGTVDVAHTTIESPDRSAVDSGTTVVLVPDGPNRLARVHTTTFTEGETRLALEQRARSRSSLALAVAVMAFLIVAWRRPVRGVERLAATAAALLVVAVAPLSGLSNVSALFDPTTFFAAMGGPLTSTIAALLITAALLLATLLFALRATLQRPSRPVAIVLVLLVAAGGPFLLRDLARGISLPAAGPGFTLWVAWQLGLALVGATVLLAGAAAGQTALGARRGLNPSVAPLIALLAGVLAPVLWDAPGAWPAWYPALWIGAIASLALTRRGLAQVMAAAAVAGCGAATLTWGATIRARTALAQHDLTRIGEYDLNAQRLLERFAISLRDDVRPVASSEVLLRRFAASELALAGYPARLVRWRPSQAVGVMDSVVSVLELAPVNDTTGAQAYMARLARGSQAIEIGRTKEGLTTLLLAAVPDADGGVTTVAVPPRTSLLPVDPFSTFTGITGARESDAQYRLTFSAAMAGDRVSPTLTWRRRGNALHGDGVAGDSASLSRVHVEVDLGGLDELLPRGALLVMLDVLLVMLLWSATALADGALGRLLAVRRRRWSRSYRVRLSGALLGFFIAPAAIFALWAWYRLQDDDRATRELLVRETLRVAAAEQEQRMLGSAPSSTGAPLFLYRAGMLTTSSDPLLDALAPLGRLLPVSLTDDDFSSDDVFATRRLVTGATRALVGYRRITTSADSVPTVLATPARGNEFALDARREDLGVLVLFATMLGALAAIWSSGVAARALARPVGALREAALDIAAGREAPTLGTAPATEFAPVYRAFGRMAEDLATSRAALEAAQRRTAAVLQHVASGVIALLKSGEIILANPRAEALLGTPVRGIGATLSELPPVLAPLVIKCQDFLESSDDEVAFDLPLYGRQLQARLTRLPTGAVLTVDDITELATAQRVLAWGEMARQVAHEIKNPLTPIRLGVQHLRRAFRDGRSDFGQILDTNVGRVLEEIDHLDEIARAFSRYGTAPSERTPAVPVDVIAVVQDVMALERLGDHDEQTSRVQWIAEMPDAGSAASWALAQRDELREVLINVLENARLAEARTVTVRVVAHETQVIVEVMDDGTGIATDVLPHVFEPHFSTRTSGSGLGLAISRRLIEGWGGTIGVSSPPEQGTTVRLQLMRAPMPSPMPVTAALGGS